MKSLKLFSLLLISLLLFGCQNTASGNSNLHQDAEQIYSAIEENGIEGQYLSDDHQQKIDEFNSNYVEKYDSFSKDDKKIILEMDKLINSYKLYFVAKGLNDGSETSYEQKINESLNELSIKFNN